MISFQTANGLLRFHRISSEHVLLIQFSVVFYFVRIFEIPIWMFLHIVEENLIAVVTVFMARIRAVRMFLDCWLDHFLSQLHFGKWLFGDDGGVLRYSGTHLSLGINGEGKTTVRFKNVIDIIRIVLDDGRTPV